MRCRSGGGSQVQGYTAVRLGFATQAPAEIPKVPDFPDHLVKNGELDLMKDGELDWDAMVGTTPPSASAALPTLPGHISHWSTL